MFARPVDFDAADTIARDVTPPEATAPDLHAHDLRPLDMAAHPDAASAERAMPAPYIPEPILAEPRPMLVPVDAPPLHMPFPFASDGLAGEAPRSVIGNDITIIGHGLRIITAGILEINGQIDGDVQGAHVIIGETGQLTGTIAANQVVVKGAVSGQIRGRDVQFEGSAHVEGDVHHERLTIATGARFEGRSRRVTEDLSTVLDAPPSAA